MVDYHDDPPRWSRIRDQAFDALKDDLILELNKHTVGLSRKNHFLPARSRKKLVTHRKLQSLSLDPSRIDLDWLVEKASTTFLITVLALDDVDSLGDALVVFRENEFNDTSLPIADLAATRIQEKQHKTQQKEVPGSVAQTYPPRSHSTTTAHTAQTELHQHSQVAKAFSGKYWNLSRLRRFYHEQWSFLVQHFDTRVFKYDIEDNRLLPFVIDTNQSTRHSGGFSDVVQAQLLGECLQTDDWLTRSPAGYHSRRISHIPVAIKELKSIDSEAYNVTHLWEAEARALAELSTPRHHNIIRCFSAFRQSNKHYFMFEWADGGSLDRFWAANHRPHLNPSRILEVLVQIRGLADALHVLHSGRRARALSSRSLLLAKANSTPGDEKASSSRSNPHSPSITLSIPDLTTSPNSQDHGDLPEDLVGSHWRHGDIKPENILRFRGPGKSKSWLGTLKLADLGSAKHHSTATQLRATVEVDYWHTMKYEPPDAYISHVTHNRSRLYDIWSLGCVFLELVTWMVWGVQGLNKVDAVTNESKAMPEGTPFWNRVGTDDATISPTASILLQTLRHHEPLCKDESALGDLVRLIEEKMLVVELPPTSKEYVKGYRANASHVLHEVNSIILRAKAESEYLFPNEVDRSRSFGTVPDIQPTGYTGLGKRQRDLDTGATLSPVTHDDSVLEQTASDIGTSHDRDTPDQHEREGELKPEVFDDLLILPPALDLDEKDDKGGTKNEITTTDISTAAVVNKRPFRARFRSKSFSHPPPKPKPQREIHATQLNIPKLNQITQIKSKMTQHFQHTLHDTWHYETDETFVNAAVDHLVTEKLRAKIFSEPTEDICDACKEFDPVSPSSFGTRTLSSLREASVYCELCAHIYTRAHKVGILSSHEVSLSRDGGVMKINGRKDTRMRICHSPYTKLDTIKSSNPIPVGLPKLNRFAISSSATILKLWLENCDNHESCRPPQMALEYCPRRLLYVGTKIDTQCRLVETDTLVKNRHLKFAAFSHPWGVATTHKHFKSTKLNHKQHLCNMVTDDFPENYRDAIRVCRAIGIEYLWIDSICILQAADGHAGDFKDEAAFVQDIYSSAYCVIAASSAEGTSSGFLNPRIPSEPLALCKNSEDDTRGCYYISDHLDDFQNDVLEGSLSERGWVMQERALARRTIFFTEKQVYFECGQGVRCETLSKLRCDRAAFLGDSNFPAYGMKHKPGAQIYLIASLYEQYSALSFSQYSDKPVAISGMELRLTRKYGISSSAGVFRQLSGKWLLWERARGVVNLSRIEFPHNAHSHPPPSWSFMSYIGAISYINIPYSDVAWNKNVRLTLPGDSNNMWLYAEHAPEMQSRILTLSNEAATKIVVANNPAKTRAERAQNEICITYDDPAMDKDLISTFVIVCTYHLLEHIGIRHYVLAVRPKKMGSGAVVYERVGAGWVPEALLETASETHVFYSVV